MNTAVLVLALTVFGASGILTQAATQSDKSQRAKIFRAAAQEYNVPESVLLAISYNETRWTPRDGEASVNNGYGQ